MAEGFFVKFWGARGSIPTPGWQHRKYGGNTPCVEVRSGEHLFICDGGTGLRELGIELERQGRAPIVAHLLFSHPHWDHIQGFPFFTPAYNPANTFYIYGTEAGDTRYFDLLSGQMKSDYFPVKFSDLGSNILPASLSRDGVEVEGVRISWLSQLHPGGSLGYRFERSGSSVVYSTDNELDTVIQNRAESDADPALLRRLPDDYIDFVRGADLLIADAQYTDEEYLTTTAGYGHPRATTVVDAAVQAEVKQLALFHHDPMHGDVEIDAKIVNCQKRALSHGSELVVFGARENVELRIDDPSRASES